MEKFKPNDENFLIRRKLNNLLSQIPLIKEMLTKTYGTDLQHEWQDLHDEITSEKMLSMDEIERLEITVNLLKEEQCDLANINEVLLVPVGVPVPDLKKPALSERDFQQLIDELTSPDPVPLETSIPAPKAIQSPVVEPPKKRKPAKIKLKPFGPESKVLRRPSSWTPLKPSLTGSANKESSDNFASSLISQSVLKNPFKIPKIKSAEASSSPSPEAVSKTQLKEINIFEKMNDKKQVDPASIINSPPLRPTEVSSCVQSFSETIAKIKIVKSPEGKKKHEIVKVVKPDEGALDRNLAAGKSSTVTSKESAETLVQVAMKTKPTEGESPEDNQLMIITDELEDDDSPSKDSLKRKQLSQSKELRRLKEDIVKDAVPLPSRRSCALKRLTVGYRDSPILDVEDVEKPPTKRVKTEEDATAAKPAEEIPILKSPQIKKKPATLVQVAKKSTAPRQAPNLRSTNCYWHPTRTTRRSTVSEIEDSKDVDGDSKVIERLLKNFDLKPCSIDLSKGLPKRKQVAMKSTSKPQNVAGSSKISEVEAQTKVPPKMTTSVYRNICNIAFTFCRNAPLYRCLLQRCKFQTMEKHTFVTHLEMRHSSTKWIGFCNLCLKTVLPTKTGHSLINEFIHMEDHCNEFKASNEQNLSTTQDVVESDKQKKSSTRTSSGDSKDRSASKKRKITKIAPEVVQEMDSLIERLCSPKSIIKKETNQMKQLIVTVQDKAPMVIELMKPLKIVSDAAGPTTKEEIATTTKVEPKMPEKLNLSLNQLKIVQAPSLNAANSIVIRPIVPKAPSIVGQTKIISKNLVGRVIPLSSLPGLKGTILNNSLKFPIKLTQLAVQPQKPEPVNQPVKADAPSNAAPSLEAVKPEEKKLQLIRVSRSLMPPKVDEGSFELPDIDQILIPRASNYNKQELRVVPTKQLMPMQQVKQSDLKFVRIGSACDYMSFGDELNRVEPTKTSNWKFVPIGASGKDAVLLKNDPLRFDEVLRPWLGIKTKKDGKCIKMLTEKVALAATYKCIGTDCSFFTSDPEVFMTHLSFHEKFSADDKENFFSCAYCHFVALTSPKALIDHINSEHGQDKFHCPYCFYRSCVDFNIIIHQNNFHILKTRLVVRQPKTEEHDLAREIAMVRKSRCVAVPQLKCGFCGAIYYVLRDFMLHVNSHPLELSTTCSKCRERINKSTIMKHLTNCHGLGLLQCVYCRFGTNTRGVMSGHIADNHASRLPFCCERVSGKNTLVVSSSIESTNLILIQQKVRPQFFASPPDDQQALRNYSKIGDLGRNIMIQGIVTQEAVKVPNEAIHEPLEKQFALKFPNKQLTRPSLELKVKSPEAHPNYKPAQKVLYLFDKPPQKTWIIKPQLQASPLPAASSSATSAQATSSLTKSAPTASSTTTSLPITLLPTTPLPKILLPGSNNKLIKPIDRPTVDKTEAPKQLVKGSLAGDSKISTFFAIKAPPSIVKAQMLQPPKSSVSRQFKTVKPKLKQASPPKKVEEVQNPFQIDSVFSFSESSWKSFPGNEEESDDDDEDFDDTSDEFDLA